MSIIIEIKDTLEADASINALVSNVYYASLPDNASRSEAYLVWMYRATEGQHTLNSKEHWGETGEISIKVLSTDPITNETIGKNVKRVMQTVDSSILADVNFQRDIQVWDEDNNLYTLNIDFDAWIYD